MDGGILIVLLANLLGIHLIKIDQNANHLNTQKDA